MEIERKYLVTDPPRECFSHPWSEALLEQDDALRETAIAAERGCGRLEWWCLDWNTPSIGFYKSLGAEAMEDWTVYRLAGQALRRLAAPESPVAETGGV